MPNNRDFRVRPDLTFAPKDEGIARGLYRHAITQMERAININPNTAWIEKSHVSLIRSGHRIGQSCEELMREEIQ